MIGQVRKPLLPLPLLRTAAMAETLISAPPPPHSLSYFSSSSSSSSLFFVLGSRRDRDFDGKRRAPPPLPCLKYHSFPCQMSKRLHARASAMAEDNNGNPRVDDSAAMGTSSFCIIEGPGALQDFSQMQLQEIRDSIRGRRDKIFRLMEEVRRLRIQERIKSAQEETVNEENEMPDFPSFIPFLPSLTPGALKQYYLLYFSIILGIILFGGLLAPILELRLGIGGTSYEDFIRNMHLPFQLSQVDPIVASFSGGAVGVISSLMVVEINNVKQQEKKRCKYCCGAGYLACARCSGSGALIANKVNQPSTLSSSERCQNCSGSGKVMCTTCLCTGMEMASEHDARIDPFV